MLKAKPVCNDSRSAQVMPQLSYTIIDARRAIDVSARDDGQSPTEARGSVVSGIATEDDLRMLGYLPDNDDQHASGAEQYVRLQGRPIIDHVYAKYFVLQQSAALSPSQRLVSPELEKAIRTIPPKPYTGKCGDGSS